MKILIISSFFPPLNSIASLRPYSWAKYWTQAGHDVTVLTTQKQQDPDVMLYLPNPGFKVVEVPQPGVVQSLKDKHKTKKTTFYGKFLQKLRETKGILSACRMPDLTDLWIRPALKAIRTGGPWDLVISTSGPYSTHLIAHRLKKRRIAKQWIADYRDAWSTNHIYSGLFPFTLIEKRLEKHILKQADLITITSAPFANEMKKSLGLDHIEVIENGMDPEDLTKIPKLPIFLNDGKFRIVHTGTVYPGKKDPAPLFRAIQTLSQDPQNKQLLDKLEVIFAGPELDHVQKTIDDMQLNPWVKCIGFISREDSLRMQRDSHALLLLSGNEMKKEGALTGNIFEYLFSGTPIICIGAKQLEASQLLVLEAKAGQCLQSEEEIEQYLKSQLASIKKKPSPPNLPFLKRYTKEALAHQLLNLIHTHVA
jgi:glycosyltransferase involved in cell wall biosynthesis